jgi:hypothetical protein
MSLPQSTRSPLTRRVDPRIARNARRVRWLWRYRVLAVVAGLFGLIRAGSTIDRFNSNVDEPYHVAAAIYLYDAHKLVVGLEQPPLGRLVAAAPLWLSGVHLPRLGFILAIGLVWERARPQLISAAILLLPPAIFLASAMAGNLDIGIRHVLPVIPFLYLMIASQLVRARLTPILLILIAVAFVETAVEHPDYASYFNALAGGEAGGGRYLADSNIDWGQYAGELSDWLHQPAQAGRTYSTRLFAAPAPLMFQVGLDPAAAMRPLSGLCCVSINVTTGLFPAPGHWQRHDYSFLKAYPIVAQFGGITVYELGKDVRTEDGLIVFPPR